MADLRGPWIRLYDRYCNNKYTSCENDRKFASLTGVVPEVAELIYSKYQSNRLSRSLLFLVLHYLKTNPTEDEACSYFGIARMTYRTRLWKTIR